MSNFYDNYYRTSDKGMRYVRAYRQFRDLFTLPASARLLDVSCGAGELLSLYSGDCEVHGLEISNVALQLVSKIVPTAHRVLGDGQNLPYVDDSFDIVFNIGSLEHYPAIPTGISEIARVLKPNGTACLVVPNSELLYYRFSLRRGTRQREIGEKLLSLPEWVSLFRTGGLRVVRVLRDRGPGIVWSPWGILRHLLVTSTFLMPLRWTYQFVFLCKSHNCKIL
ncbi:methyltransferase domain-containing protein [Acidobacteria bacterium AH-259-D05]|nr:methyltransferase domain-containing protein [Acidobacteria bacterium AH-259-D05]